MCRARCREPQLFVSVLIALQLAVSKCRSAPLLLDKSAASWDVETCFSRLVFVLRTLKSMVSSISKPLNEIWECFGCPAFGCYNFPSWDHTDHMAACELGSGQEQLTGSEPNAHSCGITQRPYRDRASRSDVEYQDLAAACAGPAVSLWMWIGLSECLQTRCFDMVLLLQYQGGFNFRIVINIIQHPSTMVWDKFPGQGFSVWFGTWSSKADGRIPIAHVPGGSRWSF